MAGSETEAIRGTFSMPGLGQAIAVTGGGRTPPEKRKKGSIPIGLAALAIGVALVWIGLVAVDAATATARVVLAVGALLCAFRSVELFRKQRFVGAGILLAIAIVLVICIFALPFDATKRIIVVGAALVMLFTGLDRIAKVLWGERFDTGLNLCFVWIILIIGAAIFADLLPLAEHQDTTKTLAIPGYQRPDLFSKHPFGTNNFSLDILARCIYGARVSLLTATFAVILSLIVGGIAGMLAGYFRGAADVIFSIITDAILAVPALILLIAFITVLGIPSKSSEAIIKIGFVLALVSVPTMARLARANTLVFAQREFVLSARAMGAKNFRIIFREIMPNVLLPLMSYAFIVVAVLIVAEGSLSFLGLGLKAPKPTWGNMIAEGQQANVLKKYPFVPLVPGVVMFLTVYSFNRIGEFARSKWDPREAKV